MFQYVLRMAASGGKAVISMFTEMGDKGGASFKKLDKSIDGTNLTLDKFIKIGMRSVAAVGAATAALGYMVQRNMDVIDGQAKLAQSFDVSYKSMTDHALAAKEYGVEINELGKAWNDLQAVIRTEKGANTIKALGLDIKELMTLSPDQLFETVAEKLSMIEDAGQRAAAAQELFGKELGRKLIPLMDGYSAKVADAAAFNEKFGISLSDIDAAQVEVANDALDRASGIVTGMTNTLTVKTAPAFLAASDALADMGYDQEAFGKIVEVSMNGVAHFLDGFVQIGRTLKITYQLLEYGFARMLKLYNDVVAKNVDKFTAGVFGAGRGTNLAYDDAAIDENIEERWSNLSETAYNISEGFGGKTSVWQSLQDARVKSLALAQAEVEGNKAHAKSLDFVAEATKKTTKESKKLSDELKEANKRTEQLTDGLLDMARDGKIELSELADIASTLFKSFMNQKNEDGVSMGTSMISSFGKSAWSTLSNLLPSFNTGIDRVPHDMVAKLHKDEKVLRPNDAEEHRRGGGQVPQINFHVENKSGARVSQPSASRGADGGINIKMMIDEAVGDLLKDPSTRTGRSARNLSGLTTR